MKLQLKLVLLVSLVVIISEIQAFDQIIPKALGCVRSLVEQKRGGIQGIQKSSQILELISENKLKEASTLCRNQKRKSRRSRISKEEQWQAVRELSLEQDLENIFYQFIFPEITCTKAGISIAAALGPQFSLKVDGAFCQASNGKRWIQISGGAGIGFGMGIGIDGNFRSYRKEKADKILTFSSTQKSALGLVIGISKEYMEEKEKELTIKTYGYKTPLMDGHDGVGLILGLLQTLKSGQIDIRILPLPQNDQYLAGMILNR